jgi:comEA protein
MLSFTKQEKLVLIFIGLIVLAGLSLNFYQKSTAYFDLQKIIDEQKSPPAINLNRASLQDLASISAIGPALAEAIINFRNLNGPFKSLEELKLIKGINESRLKQIKTFLTLD